MTIGDPRNKEKKIAIQLLKILCNKLPIITKSLTYSNTYIYIVWYVPSHM